MLAKELVWLGNQVCAWLTPRMTKVLPSASTIPVPLTRSPTAACAGLIAASMATTGVRRAAAAPAMAKRVLITYL